MAKKVILKKGKESALLRRHPWIFSGAIHSTEGSPKDGDFVSVHSNDKELIGWGFMGAQSIAVKMLIFSGETFSSPKPILNDLLQSAIDLRKHLGLFQSEGTNAFRLVNGEGDSLPGLIIDLYAHVAVIQCHSLGMFIHREHIASTLTTILPNNIKAVFDKSADTLSDFTTKNQYLVGSEPTETIINENSLLFKVNWEVGQKTGFFLDQRDNRKLISTYAQGRRVLNTFSYSGGFSLYALRGGAQHVISADVSSHACQLAHHNALLNGFESRHETKVVDCLDYLANMQEEFDLIILDPPAFAKHRSGVKGAIKGYRAINRHGFRKLSPGGLLATFSCSQLISASDFESIVLSAAIESGRPARIIHRLGAAPCHPSNLYHPEGSYLKGLLIEVG